MNEIFAIVCPKQKVIRIEEGKGRKRKVLKIYTFKQDIPMVEKVVVTHHHDYGAWSVSDRDWETEEIRKVYDPNIIKSLQQKALNFYNSTL